MSSLCQRLFITPKYKHTNYKFRNPRACSELTYINEHTSVQSEFKEVNWKRRRDGEEEEGVDYILSKPPTSTPITPSIQPQFQSAASERAVANGTWMVI